MLWFNLYRALGRKRRNGSEGMKTGAGWDGWRGFDFHIDSGVNFYAGFRKPLILCDWCCWFRVLCIILFVTILLPLLLLVD